VKQGNTVSVPTAEALKEFHKVRDHMVSWFEKKYGKVWLDKWMAATKAAEAAVDGRNDVLINNK